MEKEIKGSRKQNGKKQSTKKPKDSNAPKMPLTAFFRFKGAMREEVKRENPEASYGDIAKILGKLWNELENTKKDAFKEESNREMEVWRKEKKDYEAQKAK